MARLDRLGAAKEVAQIGAAIGREFSHALLAAVAGKPEAQLNSALDRLVAAGSRASKKRVSVGAEFGHDERNAMLHKPRNVVNVGCFTW